MTELNGRTACARQWVAFGLASRPKIIFCRSLSQNTNKGVKNPARLSGVFTLSNQRLVYAVHPLFDFARHNPHDYAKQHRHNGRNGEQRGQAPRFIVTGQPTGEQVTEETGRQPYAHKQGHKFKRREFGNHRKPYRGQAQFAHRAEQIDQNQPNCADRAVGLVQGGTYCNRGKTNTLQEQAPTEFARNRGVLRSHFKPQFGKQRGEENHENGVHCLEVRRFKRNLPNNR